MASVAVLIIVHIRCYNKVTKNTEVRKMKIKYAVALMSGEEETILGIFNTKKEADEYGASNVIPHSAGLEYCFASKFRNGVPIGNSIEVYNYYNV